MRIVLRVLAIISGAVFAVALGLLVFIYGTHYGVLYTGTLLWEALEWVCLLSGIGLLFSLIPLIRSARKPEQASGFIGLSIVSALLNLLALAMLTPFFVPFFDEDTRWDQYRVYTSPEGTHQVVVYFPPFDNKMHAYPMLNRWVFKEVDNGYVEVEYDGPWWLACLQEDEYTVEWPSEHQAVVTVEGETPIIVDFD